MMARADLANVFAAQKPVLGTWLQLGHEEVVDALATAGLSFLIADMEHAPFGIDMAARLTRAAEANGLLGLMRVRRNDAAEIASALDAGASAVVVPGVRCADGATAAVRAGRFEPDGHRGACPCVRDGGQLVTNWAAYARDRNARRTIVPLIESQQGVDNADEIAATSGIAAIMAGPFDLAVSLGYGGDTTREPVVDALARIVAAAQEADVPAIMPVFERHPDALARTVAEWRRAGVGAFTIGTDKLILATQAHTLAAAASTS